MKTMMVVTMIASVTTLALLIFAGGKVQQKQEEYSGKLDEIKANPVNAILALVGVKR